MSKHSSLAVILLILVVLITACTPGVAATPVVSSGNSMEVPAAASPTAPAPTYTHQPTEPLPAPTQKAEAPASPVESTGSSFVLFDKKASTLSSYGLDGSLRYKAPAPELEYPTFYALTVLKEAVYYASEGMEKSIFRTSADGAIKLDLTVQKLSAFKVSPDEKWIAWSTFNGEVNPPSSQLWVGNLDGKGGVTNAKQIASYSIDPSQALWLVPIKWAEDNSGRLFFERSMIGLGGYILYGGHFSLYGYDTTSGQITTYVAAEENPGMCIDTVRLDLDKVVFNCVKGSHQVTIRTMENSQEVMVPALPEQGTAGSTEFSPSGQWLAYAVARNNPDDEAGQVVVVPSDLSAEPKVIYKVSQQRYPVVQGWIDDETLLLTIFNNNEPRNTVLTIKRDGTGAQEIASGQFVGWVK